MYVIQTIKNGGYKLALAFTALTTVSMMTMGAQALAYSFNLSTGFYSQNTIIYNKTFTGDDGRTCTVNFEFGNYWTAAVARIQKSSSSHGCTVAVMVHTPGSQPAGPLVVNDQNNTNWATSASSAYTTFQWAAFYVEPWGDSAGGMVFQIHSSYGAGYYYGDYITWCYGECYAYM